MKRLITLILALCLCAGLCACSGSDAPRSPTTEPRETVTEPPVMEEIPETTVPRETQEELYAKSGTLEDGTTFTAYRRGGPEGTKVKLIYDTPAGVHYEEYYDPAGVIEYSFTTMGDGSSYAIEYYPSGNMARSITTEPDGSYLEVYFLDNGYIDANGMLTSGDGYFEKEVSADGQVTDRSHYRGPADDGTIWSIEQQEDGTVMRVHYKRNGTMIEIYGHNLDTGRHIAELYDADGNKTSTEIRYDRREEYYRTEYYEDGTVKYRIQIHEDGTEQEDRFHSSGDCTYLRIQGLEDTTEYFADDTGNLEKYVMNATAYEGEAISDEVRQTWETIKPNPAEEN